MTCLLTALCAASEKEKIDYTGYAGLVLKHSNNINNSSPSKSDEMFGFEAGIDGVYSTAENIELKLKTSILKELYSATENYSGFIFHPEIQVENSNIIFKIGHNYTDSFEDYETGISTTRDKYLLNNTYLSAMTELFTKTDVKIVFDYLNYNYSGNIYNDRTEKTTDASVDYNFYGNSKFLAGLSVNSISFAENFDFQNNIEFRLYTGISGNVSQNAKGDIKFGIRRKNYKSLNDVTKPFFAFNLENAFSKKLNGKIGFSYDIYTNDFYDYNPGIPGNRYYEKSLLSFSGKYDLNEKERITACFSFARKTYSDLKNVVMPADKFFDYSTEYERKISYKKLNFTVGAGLRYFTKRIAPDEVKLNNQYEGFDITSKILFNF